MTKPIRPEEVVETKTASIPPEVLEAFNNCISKKWDGNRAKVYVWEAVQKIGALLGVDEATVHAHPEWLNIEDIYRKEGWKVDFDKPGYNESYRAFYVFGKK